MKKLQVPIEAELLQEVKVVALKQGKTLKELVSEALKAYISGDFTTTNTTTNTTNTTSTPTETIYPITDSVSNTSNTPTSNSTTNINTNLDMTFVIRKTHRTVLSKKDVVKTLGPLKWTIAAGHKAHYDASGTLIPFRFTDEDGNVFDLDEDDIHEIEMLTGKVVVREE